MPDLNVHPLSLRFSDPRVERDFTEYWLPRLRLQARAALVLGLTVYICYGLVDYWLLNVSERTGMWGIRLGMTVLTVATLLLTFHRNFARFSSWPLALTGFAAGLSLLMALRSIPVEVVSHYSVGLVLVAFFTYNLVGARFIHALSINLSLLALYNLLVWSHSGIPTSILASLNFFLFSANLMGGTAGYLAERQRRQLFMRERELDAQRQHHQQRALHDALTGLPNRELLLDRLEHAVAQAQRHGELCAGFYVDLDGFKQVNDEWGHEVGDALLRSVADCLRGSLREADTVARLGGDEFFVLAEQLPSVQAAQALGEKLRGALAHAVLESHTHWGQMLHSPVNASIGACLFPYPNASGADIIRRADLAMYAAKRAGKGRCIFAPMPPEDNITLRAVG